MWIGLVRCKMWIELVRPVLGVTRGSADLYKNLFIFSKIKILLIIKKIISTTEKLKFYPCFDQFN